MNNYCECNNAYRPKSQKCAGITIVIIPMQSGDSTGVFAPKLGDYKNTVVKYLADNKVFLYDKDGNWTEIGETEIPGVTLDTELSLASPNAVENRVITQGINNVELLANSIAGSVVDERNDRIAADGVLQGNIDAEVLARQEADNTLQGNINAEVTNRENADLTLQGNIDAEVIARGNAITGVENKINQNFVEDLVMTSNENSVTITEHRINPVTGATTVEQDTIPSASIATAGTISAADYQAIIESEQLTKAILEGAVAIDNLPAAATQADLTAAWTAATGYDDLINRASIYDISNSLIWTYYENSALWYSASAGITINNFTNSTAGTILGSSTDGNVSANVDGTGTVSGWSTVKNDITALQTDKADASSLATVATTGDYGDLLNKPTIPTVNNATLTIQSNGTNVATFTANASSNVTANISSPVITMQTTDPGEGAALAANNFIAVYSA